MFIVSVYDLREAPGKEVVHYNYQNFQKATEDYLALSESYDPEIYGVLLYTGNGDIVLGFEDAREV